MSSSNGLQRLQDYNSTSSNSDAASQHSDSTSSTSPPRPTTPVPHSPNDSYRPTSQRAVQFETHTERRRPISRLNSSSSASQNSAGSLSPHTPTTPQTCSPDDVYRSPTQPRALVTSARASPITLPHLHCRNMKKLYVSNIVEHL